jgi:peptidoglycan/xylan/chitin deacetylase (PgdA/CDA1 family)
VSGGRDVLVLCYHGISERWPAPTAVLPERIEEQLDMLVRRGYTGATFSEALTAPVAARTLVVTFDDATRSVARYALPVMERLGLVGTVFVPTAFAGDGRPLAWEGQEQWLGTEHAGELECMSWDELRDLAGRGWEVGSHTRSHPRLTALDDERLADELRGSLEDCEERLGEPCRSLAYPYSDVDDRVVRAAGRAGYRFAGVVPRGPAAPFPLLWPRVGVYRDDTSFRLRARIWRRRALNGSGPSRAADAALRRATRLLPR